jgi:hypothetical protein
MSKHEKRLERMRNNPKGIRPAQVDSLLIHYGFEKRRSGKNHCVYSYGIHILIVNFHRAYVHPKAIKEILDTFDELLEGE